MKEFTDKERQEFIDEVDALREKFGLDTITCIGLRQLEGRASSMTSLRLPDDVKISDQDIGLPMVGRAFGTVYRQFFDCAVVVVFPNGVVDVLSSDFGNPEPPDDKAIRLVN